MATGPIIIFGPSGNVGSAAACSANLDYGAKVVLAMRDPLKPIPGLSAEQERNGGFEKVQANLVKPETVHNAVSKTGAERAFIYIGRGSPDNLRSTIETLKSAGIKFVVFLSSDTIQTDIKSVTRDNFRAWAHAQIEINLAEVFGPQGYVAIRPSFFASNAFWWKSMVRDGEVKAMYPDAKFDWISPGDVGRVSAAFLVGGPRALDGTNGQNFVRLCGPELLSRRDAVATIGRVLAKDIKLTEIDEKQGLEMFVRDQGMPEPVAKEMTSVIRSRAAGGGVDGLYDDVIGNVQKYTGRPSTKFKEWVEEVKEAFSA